MTDDFGMLQFADYALPDYRSGYTVDDNARALMVATKHYQLYRDEISRELAVRYLSFMRYAQKSDGRFHNFLSYDRSVLGELDSEDTLGRALIALAMVMTAPPLEGISRAAERLFCSALPLLRGLKHPRGWALGICALYYWIQSRPEKSAGAYSVAAELADRLLANYQDYATLDWRWFLPEMTYSNAVLPEGLFRAYQLTGEKNYLKVAADSFSFFSSKAFRNGVLCLVGNAGWFNSDDKEPPLFDQQPIDAASMVHSALAGFESTGRPKYLRVAEKSMDWFFGNNISGIPLYDPETGGCFDALMEQGVNLNRGAESTVCMLLANLTLSEATRSFSGGRLGVDVKRIRSNQDESELIGEDISKDARFGIEENTARK